MGEQRDGSCIVVVGRKGGRRNVGPDESHSYFSVKGNDPLWVHPGRRQLSAMSDCPTNCGFNNAIWAAQCTCDTVVFSIHLCIGTEVSYSSACMHVLLVVHTENYDQSTIEKVSWPVDNTHSITHGHALHVKPILLANGAVCYSGEGRARLLAAN
eukprot:303980-Chlamydomonas_euryale.AAC.28